MMKSAILKTVILFFLLSTSQALGQQMLYLKKKHTAKMVKLELYDVLKVKLKNGEIVKGNLYNITPNAIWVGDSYIDYVDVEYIRHNHMFWKMTGRSLQYGSVFFASIFAVNSLIGGFTPILTPDQLYLLGSIMVVGVVLELIAIRTYRVDKGWTFEPIIIPEE